MQNSAKRASIYLGVFLAVVMIAGIFLPYLTRNLGTATTNVQPTDTVLPTFPPPPSNLDSIRFDKVYLHPSGIFSLGQPDGWNASQPNKGATIAQINLTNNTMLSVVDSYIEAVPTTPDQLSAHFSESVINASWSNFSAWTETNRTMQGDHLIIDFTVTLTGRTYVARQDAWTDGTWIYAVRVLVPENATDLLRYLLDNFMKSLQPQTEFKGMPLDWNAYYDPDASHIIRYPSQWTVTDSAPGRPTSISSSSGDFLRVESRANTSIADEAAARTFVTGLRSGMNVVSVQPVTRLLGQGFSVAYSYTTVDGSQESGLTVLLNAPDGALHIADLLFPASSVDLNNLAQTTPPATAEASSAVTPEATIDATTLSYAPLAQVMSSFYVIQPLNLSPASLPSTATPTPQPLATLPQPTLALTIAPPASTGEVTSEATAQPTIMATPGAAITEAAATVEATAQTTAQAMVEATPEVTTAP